MGKFSDHDGIMFGYAGYLAYTLNKCQEIYEVLEKACVGAFCQARPFAVTKGMILWLSVALMIKLIS